MMNCNTNCDDMTRFVLIPKTAMSFTIKTDTRFNVHNLNKINPGFCNNFLCDLFNICGKHEQVTEIVAMHIISTRS